MLSKAQKLLAAELLRMASVEFSSNGCNDFDLKDHVKCKEDIKALFEELDTWDKEKNPECYENASRNTTLTCDWLVMSWLADLFEEDAKE
jgi:hypothetical protein